MGYQIIVLVAWSPSGAALDGRNECTLSQAGPNPDLTLDVAKNVKQ